MKPRPRSVSLFFLLAIVAAVLGHASQAAAQVTELINVPAIAFLAGTATFVASVGIVQGTAGDFARAAVQFTKLGLQVCRVSMWAHDNNAADVTARLIRKQITTAPTAFGPPPETIASVSSTGASDTMRRFSTFTVSAPVVSASYFYWVELDWEGLVDVAGLRIETATTCS